MKVIGYYCTGSDSVLELIEAEKPQPGPHDLLISVKAVSVNPVDFKLRSGFPPEPGSAKIPGYDAAGVVEAVGSAVTLFSPGDEVYYSGLHTRQGSNAQFQLVDERITGNKPVSLTWAEAAALPLTTLTAWELLFNRLRVRYGEKTRRGSLLIINGAGGVGSVLTQLARRLTGLTVITTASRPETIAWSEKMGAHHVINHYQPLAAQIRALGIEQIEYVAGLQGTQQQIHEIADIIAPQGYLSLIDDGAFDSAALKAKSVTVTWEMIFTRALFSTADQIAQHDILNEVAALIDSGILVTTMTENLGPLTVENLRLAHRRLETSATIGKIALDGFN
ncbi:zinc-binding alcohol dehydrogenase family protein [Pantoea agglomerans]